MKKALVIGINEYPYPNKLRGCVNDAQCISKLLSTNGNFSRNFDVKLLLDSDATKKNIFENIKNLYQNNDFVSLLYFSGHGYDNRDDGSLITVDLEKIKFKEIMEMIDSANTKYNVIILDCCFSGKMANDTCIGDKTVLSENTVILTACRSNEAAVDNGLINHGTFTNLLIAALEGGSADLLGRITPASIYSFIDQALGSWEQRPFFKANVSSFLSLRDVNPKITVELLKKGLALFPSDDYLLQLDPSFEYTNNKWNNEHKPTKPYAKKENVEKMKILQKFNQNGLVIPVDEEFMYYAAMNTKKVKLTELGKNYWKLARNNRI